MVASCALDLRDRETEGHSQRVAALSVRLAEMLGVSGDELIHLRHGALLHDIGKVGVPDHILHKAGPLTDEEWAIMRQHPVHAYRLLVSNQFLRAALPVPYCHHEKWDGSGYPRGLKGTEIPLAARIFAVADVWDALTSDRPYRPAWANERALAYIREQAGKHFDPAVVAAFLQLAQAGELD
jgi:HD-GYP domain-containing protein (c-di-GMP phosphodiesterase class II)